jgi:CheY-like chemotaxis protein
VVREAIDLLRPTIPSTANFVVDIDSNTGCVLADATELHQIVMNLCTNAYYSLENEVGEIHIHLRPVLVDHAMASEYPNLREGAYALLTVRDTGTGMDALTMSRIFEPFFTTKEQGKGTGMGLAVVHGIVQSCGGAIGVESSPGSGSTFKVFFPLGEAAAHNARADSLQLPHGTERILLVDDEPSLVDLGEKVLRSLGYDVFATVSAREAFEVFKANPDSFALIITDQTMPEMSGDLLAKEAMSVRPGIPVIICTGHSSMLDEEKARAIGIRALLMKPFDIKRLARSVRKAIDESV